MQPSGNGPKVGHLVENVLVAGDLDTSMVTWARAAGTTSNANIDPSRRGFSSDVVLSKQIRCRLVAGRK